MDQISSIVKLYVVSTKDILMKSSFIAKFLQKRWKYRLICSDWSLDGNYITRIYQKRWNIEVYHKSLKSNACISKSPTRTVRTQSNHLFLSICSVVKLEQLKIHHKMNHFALKAKIYLNSLKAAYAEISCLKKAAA